ncbi:zinc finger protein ZIC 4 isoform X6 [Alosa sapidissima]|uniref:zinc finger protein ZIC 4 isoform X6 n=1 Tax=Alosa sapidissima TaxID=34773 RepID=UPI001C0847E8|nr:zinc finger protein ZIC 4 isoform X6 [Alosa sapidissima]
MAAPLWKTLTRQRWPLLQSSLSTSGYQEEPALETELKDGKHPPGLRSVKGLRQCVEPDSDAFGDPWRLCAVSPAVLSIRMAVITSIAMAQT